MTSVNDTSAMLSAGRISAPTSSSDTPPQLGIGTSSATGPTVGTSMKRLTMVPTIRPIRMPGIRLSIRAQTKAMMTTIAAMDSVWKFGICQSVASRPRMLSPSTS